MTNHLTRRTVLQLGLASATAAVLASCTGSPQPSFVTPSAPVVRSTEQRRRATGATVRRTVTAIPTTLDLGGIAAPTWGYQGASATTPLRANVGDLLQVTLKNQLPDPTSIHWHGLALRNDMDGVPPLTQPPVEPGDSFQYSFTLPHPGTYWFHPHVGSQLDRALMAPLIIDDPSETVEHSEEWILVLDDWLDGVTTTPDDVLAELSRGMGSGMTDGMGGGHGMSMASSSQESGGMRMSNTLMGATSDLLGGDAGDVFYPLFLINGRPTNDPETFSVAPGTKIRLRIINAGADTAFRFGVAEHLMTITHTDGYAVQPALAESLVVGMGERYDALITAGDGAFSVVAEALGKNDRARAVLRTAPSAATPPAAELPWTRGPVTASDLQAEPEVVLAERATDRTLALELTGSMASYDWAIDGKRMDMDQPLRDALGISEGERVALELKNSTSMWHPMHLHGHTYQHLGGGPRKDTSIVLPGQTLRALFDADNPGSWLLHCHNLYHGEAGMMTTIAYTTS
ncbi:multicopper oxidase family protein [Quadrisphaera setariae]|uniref:Multicopper oxidase family protein n=1 Tax=Quadrisphaera setariae TaxID=2593304 RepID=A0A5C8Z2V2_9ACTN|nr:multicopper oxidase family protein [Quadrisphaera setariae]TXR52412.1 multicopper oxidase family protein [Quadrisphaera setariae]